jgi:hypothetical protein
LQRIDDKTSESVKVSKSVRVRSRTQKGASTGALTDEGVSAKRQRTLVFHYHFFKNAGTSVDEMLRQNFGVHWANQEFPGARRENGAAVEAFIRASPQLEAISSHTALLPVPQIEGLYIFPIVFVRHPLDRLRSAYEFERGQRAETAGARLAKKHDFGGYLRELLGNKPLRLARNFQTFRLSQDQVNRKGSELERALRTIDGLPFVGLVEEFDTSLARLEELMRAFRPTFRSVNAHANASRSRGPTLQQRLAATEREIGRELFRQVSEANRDDLYIYNHLLNGLRQV